MNSVSNRFLSFLWRRPATKFDNNVFQVPRLPRNLTMTCSNRCAFRSTWNCKCCAFRRRQNFQKKIKMLPPNLDTVPAVLKILWHSSRITWATLISHGLQHGLRKVSPAWITQFRDHVRNFGGFWNSGRQRERLRSEARPLRVRNATVHVDLVVRYLVFLAIGPSALLGDTWGRVGTLRPILSNFLPLEALMELHVGPSLHLFRVYVTSRLPFTLSRPNLFVRPQCAGWNSKRVVSEKLVPSFFRVRRCPVSAECCVFLVRVVIQKFLPCRVWRVSVAWLHGFAPISGAHHLLVPVSILTWLHSPVAWLVFVETTSHRSTHGGVACNCHERNMAYIK